MVQVRRTTAKRSTDTARSDQAEQFATTPQPQPRDECAAEPLADDDAEATRLAGGGLVADITAGVSTLDEALAEIAQA